MTNTDAATRRIDIPAAGHYRLDPLRTRLTLRTRLFGVRALHATMYVADGQIDVNPIIRQATVTAAISAASFSTDNPRRDNDIRSPRFLDADQFPEISYRADNLIQNQGRWRITGELTVRNVRRPVTLEIKSVQRTGQGFLAHATTRLNRAAFELATAKWMGGRVFRIDVIAAAEPHRTRSTTVPSSTSDQVSLRT